jgi:hypothetical protein
LEEAGIVGGLREGKLVAGFDVGGGGGAVFDLDDAKGFGVVGYQHSKAIGGNLPPYPIGDAVSVDQYLEDGEDRPEAAGEEEAYEYGSDDRGADEFSVGPEEASGAPELYPAPRVRFRLAVHAASNLGSISAKQTRSGSTAPVNPLSDGCAYE